ncbi:MAG: hypothetical protein RL154_1215 [Pseudomonadota bacterium]|jgi:hypothetical protein
MSLRSYALFGFLYVCAVGAMSLFFVSGDYTISILGYSETLPSAAWIVLPVVFLYIASGAHIGFARFTQYLKVNSYKNDYESLIEQIEKKFLDIEESKEFKNSEFKSLSDFVAQSNIAPKARFKLNIAKIDKIAELRHKILVDSEYVDLAKFRLSKENSLSQKNMENRLTADPKFAEDVLKSCDKPTPLCNKAMEAFVEYADLNKIKKIDFTPSKSCVMKLLRRFIANESYTIDIDYVKQLCVLAKFDKDDYITLARLALKKGNPDEALELFYILSKDNHEAMSAYIYLHLELEMTDKAKELVALSDDDEFLLYKAFICLKASGKSIRLNSFLDQIIKPLELPAMKIIQTNEDETPVV